MRWLDPSPSHPHFLSRSRRVALTTVACLTLIFAAPLRAVAAAPAFEQALATFAQANNGERSAIEPAAEAFETLLGAEPGNPVLMAYAGAAGAMRARTTLLPWKKMAYAEDGLAQLDKALALLRPTHDAPWQGGIPAALDVKFTAASTFLAVPGFMNRAARGARLLDEVLASPLFAAAPLSFKGRVWLRAAALAADEQRTADARRLLGEVTASGAPQAAEAAARLKALGS